MNKRLWGLAAFLALGGLAAAYWPNAAHDKLPDAGLVQAAAPQRNGLAIKVGKEQIYRGSLLLVNKEHPVSWGSEANEAMSLQPHKELTKGSGLKETPVLTREPMEKFSAMAEAAGKDGIGGFPFAGRYRDVGKRERVCGEKSAECLPSPEIAEHRLGLSFDIRTTREDLDQTPEGRWLRANAWKFGFIRRYPNDKTAITGVRDEPWHYRYVGLPHSAIMLEKGLVLEQYLDLLRAQKKLTVTIDRQAYEIFYYPVEHDMTLYVPATGSYELSGDNREGVVVTVSHPVRISTSFPPGGPDPRNRLSAGRTGVASSVRTPGGSEL